MANTSYQKAYDELQLIVTKLQNDEIGLDDLSKSVKRAGELIRLTSGDANGGGWEN